MAEPDQGFMGPNSLWSNNISSIIEKKIDFCVLSKRIPTFKYTL